ncbi:hypothetical protein MATL_G00120440 [Megalops atlanticus]|uniref:PPM-type phosphatase domain-containing protein n=1 Tax=Megalops atlanticus TaxID=7932 RepID=A0A9D3Q0T1_MEGAT|nr:hypothetical protein MATL_G00120440 [Megalops atlanticus]
MDLFGDLPEPTQTAGGGKEQTSQLVVEDRGEKRKREVTEELEEKKAWQGFKGMFQHAEVREKRCRMPMSSYLTLAPASPQCLPKSLFPKGEVENLDKLVKRCLLDTFKQTDEEFLKQASSQKPAWKDGTTATCMLVVDDMLYVANLGDSRALLCRVEQDGQNDSRKCATLALSKEHNPTCYEERMRIQKAGGTVRDGRVLGVLEVSRSLGDGQYKRCGVISTPDLRRCQLTHNDRFVILACDGLFKVFTPEEAVKFVLSVLQDGTVEWKEGQTAEDGRFEVACQRLANEAVRRGCADNVTVILVSVHF